MHQADREFDKNPVEKFHNKKYYNPNYHYYMEGPDVLRLYTEKDNSYLEEDFTDVLDSAYMYVRLLLTSVSSARARLPILLLRYSLLL